MEENAHPFLLILSSPSGAGKTTITHRLLTGRLDTFTFSISHTTRAPRPNEVDGQDYHFVSEEAFKEDVKKNRFVEWARVHGNFYGTSTRELERAQAAGHRGIIFDVDYQGARQIKAKYRDAVGVFVLPPSLPELKARLEKRAADSAETIERRYKKAKEEIEHYPYFDYIVVNKDLERALSEVAGIVDAEQSRQFRRAALAETLLHSGDLE